MGRQPLCLGVQAVGQEPTSIKVIHLLASMPMAEARYRCLLFQ